jgi:hypothetical protein
MENIKTKSLKTLAVEITRRNFYLKSFFSINGINITLMGDRNNPLIVMQDNIVLSCYAHNFELIFKDDTHNGNEVFRVKLKANPIEIKRKLLQWINSAKHRKIYLFQSKGFYFSKYVKIMEDQLPLFTPRKDLAYYVFNRQKAIEVKGQLTKEEPNIEIIY